MRDLPLSLSDGVHLGLVGSDQFEEYLRTLQPVYGIEVTDDAVQRWRAVADPQRLFAVVDRGTIVATAEAQPVTLTVPGGTAPMAALTSGRVLPSHRRRGLFAEVLRLMFTQARDLGEPVAGMWPSEASIYQRFGFAAATSSSVLTVTRADAGLPSDPGDDGRARLVDGSAARQVLSDIYDRARAVTPGMVSRSAGHWDRWLVNDPDHWLDPSWHTGVGPRTCVVWGDSGYAVYRQRRQWPEGSPEHQVLLAELISTDTESYRGLWKWCLDLDLTRSLLAQHRSADEPLRLLVRDARRLSFRLVDGLWLRLLDLPVALSARRYSRGGSVVFDVVDPAGFASGRCRLTVDADGEPGAAVPAPSAHADLTLPVTALTAAYLGGTRLRELHRAGLVEEHSPGAVGRLDAMMTGDREPWCPWLF